jgi:hypothetical protein
MGRKDLEFSYLYVCRRSPVLSSYSRLQYLLLLFIFVVSGGFLVQGQESQKDQKATAAPAQADSQQDPLKRPKKKDDKAAQIEKLGGVYKKWLDEDVRWIITDEELSAFKKLTTNAERDVFIEGFWQRRQAAATGQRTYRRRSA